jgi:hypothetical protein
MLVNTVHGKQAVHDLRAIFFLACSGCVLHASSHLSLSSNRARSLFLLIHVYVREAWLVCNITLTQHEQTQLPANHPGRNVWRIKLKHSVSSRTRCIPEHEERRRVSYAGQSDRGDGEGRRLCLRHEQGRY